MEEPTNEWQEPPLPETIKPEEPAQMSEIATLGNVFFDPGSTFDDLKRKPRFIFAMILIALSISAFQISFIEKVGLKKIVTAQFDASSRAQQMPADQKAQQIEMQSSTVAKYITYGVTPVVIVIGMFLGGLLYWGGANAMGGEAGFLKSVSVWTYSSLPPTIVSMAANLIVLFLKPVDDIDLGSSQQGLVSANPTMFLDLKESPVLNSVLSAIDLFAIWGLALAAIGLSRVAKISSGAGWAVVLTISLFFLAIRVGWVAIFG
ncbi:MAG: YIP1 family protein [Acidobacteria bacterium]|nr:YIP1 family protein [Acidobacteriota bacterium]